MADEQDQPASFWRDRLLAASDLGRRRVVLDVGDHNTAAQRLYARAGFRPTGRTGTLPPPREHVTEHELARAVEQ